MAELNKKLLKGNRLVIIGLLSLAKTANKEMRAIEKQLTELTREGEEYGHCGDLVWSEIENKTPEQGYKYLLERSK